MQSNISAISIFEGLEYMHVVCTPKIIHRDVKTANILLDSNLKGKLGDFGLLKIWINGEASHGLMGKLHMLPLW